MKHPGLKAPWKPGQSGNPDGRPKGTRNKLSELFWSDLFAKWQEKGLAAIDAMIEQRPGDFVRVVASQMPQELNVVKSPLSELSDDELTSAIQHIRQLIAGQAAEATGGDARRTGDATKH